MKTSRIARYAMGAVLICSAVSGCGPGMPFMTAEQDALVTNVDKLMKDNEAFNKRLALIEAAGGAQELKKEITSLKSSVAGTNMEMEKLRHEFSFVRGASEESQHEKDDLKGSISGLGAKLNALNEKTASIEASGKTTSTAIGELKALIDGAETRISEIKAKVAALDGRMASVPAIAPARQTAAPEA